MTRARFLLALALVAGAVLLLQSGQGAALHSWLGNLATPEALSGRDPWLIGLVLAAGTLVSEDLTCLAAGALVARGALGFAPAAAACFLGIFAGDVLLFLCGRWFGRELLARAPFARWLDAERVNAAGQWLERRGPIVILTSRFLPGARLPTYFASGALGTSLARFTLWFALAGALWTPLVVSLAVALAAGLGGGLTRLEFVRAHAGWALLGTLLVGWSTVALARSLATWRGRALWRSRGRRWTRFEYWPVGLFYLPVFALVLARALRGQGLVFTAANPALPHGGFVGESKRAIYARLAAGGAPLPRTLLLARAAPAARRAAVHEFQRAHGLEFPIVIKPDAGQRGDGVRIVRDEEGLRAALASDEALVVQEHVSGEEYGLFYARAPGAAQGELLSITHKVLPALVGDGVSTLERLVLAHPEHAPMAPVLLRRPFAELARVPAAGERVGLGELGTHCRGARFLDGGALATDELRLALERCARAVPGFHFGRFDVRAASAADLRRGRFTILELNGVTSEAGHMYDPRFGLLGAWRALFGQWRRAYAIGAVHARAGARVSTLRELVAEVRGYRALARRRARTEALPERAALEVLLEAAP